MPKRSLFSITSNPKYSFISFSDWQSLTEAMKAPHNIAFFMSSNHSPYQKHSLFVKLRSAPVLFIHHMTYDTHVQEWSVCWSPKQLWGNRYLLLFLKQIYDNIFLTLLAKSSDAGVVHTLRPGLHIALVYQLFYAEVILQENANTVSHFTVKQTTACINVTAKEFCTVWANLVWWW